MHGLGENKFVASFCIRMFQKRVRITQDIGIEFVAGGTSMSLSEFLVLI